MFNIEFTSEPFFDKKNVKPARCSKITIGNYWEFLHTPLNYWTEKQYENNWKETIDQLQRNSKMGVFITELPDPGTTNFGECWVAYREKELLYFRNTLIKYKTKSKKINIPLLIKSIKPRKRNDQVSEWSLPFNDFVRSTISQRIKDGLEDAKRGRLIKAPEDYSKYIKHSSKAQSI